MTTRAQNYDRALSMHHRGCPVVVARCAATNACMWRQRCPRRGSNFSRLPVLASVLLGARCGALEAPRGYSLDGVSNFVSNFVLLSARLPPDHERIFYE